MTRRDTLAQLIITSSLVLSACGGRQSSLNPQGPAASYIAVLWWVMFAVGTVIFLGVMGVLGLALFRRREAVSLLKSSRRAQTWIVGGGIVMPAVVLLGVFAHTVWTLKAIEAITPSNDITIEVIGHQWWWEVRYPNQQVTTANEIHIPAGEPVALRLTSNDVIHSLWVPELHGKLDLTPGRTDTLVLQADRPGEYYGQCAEFCGVQHARMGLVVVAEPAETYSIWLDSQAAPAVTPADALALAGQEVFLGSRCAECHTIRGTAASGKTGPDLTHLASRLTLAAGTLHNTPENLADWIMDPQFVKPGNKMPVIELADDRLQSLLAYLATLK